MRFSLSRVRNNAAVPILLSLSLLAGAQLAALADGNPPQSGYDVAVNCEEAHPPSRDPTTGQLVEDPAVAQCVQDGCRKLHGLDDQDGFTLCMTKAWQVRTEWTGEPQYPPGD